MLAFHNLRYLYWSQRPSLQNVTAPLNDQPKLTSALRRHAHDAPVYFNNNKDGYECALLCCIDDLFKLTLHFAHIDEGKRVNAAAQEDKDSAIAHSLLADSGKYQHVENDKKMEAIGRGVIWTWQRSQIVSPQKHSRPFLCGNEFYIISIIHVLYLRVLVCLNDFSFNI